MPEARWPTRRLAEVCSKITDGTHRSPAATQSGRLYVTSKNIRPFRFDVSKPTFISEADHREIYSRCDVRRGDVLLTKDGANTGNACLNPLSEPFSLLSSVALIRANPDLLAPEFLVQVLNSSAGRSLSASRMDGLAIRRLTLEKINALPLALPPIPEQRKIAAILSSVDETIERTEAVIAQLDVVKKAMLDELLTRGVRRSTDGWRSVRLDQISTIRRGASPRPIQDSRWFSTEGPGWVRIADVTRSKRILLATEQKLSSEGVARSVRIKPGDLIMSIAATIGKPIISGLDACIHDGFVFFDKLDGAVNPEFLFYFLQWKSAEFAGLGQHGTQKNINSAIVGAMAIRLPPMAEQVRIASAIGSVDDTRERTEGEIAQLNATKRSLTAALLQDELRVNFEAGSA